MKIKFKKEKTWYGTKLSIAIYFGKRWRSVTEKMDHILSESAEEHPTNHHKTVVDLVSNWLKRKKNAHIIRVIKRGAKEGRE
jgi:hypothetical protein